jgi:hypothetical protein
MELDAAFFLSNCVVLVISNIMPAFSGQMPLFYWRTNYVDVRIHGFLLTWPVDANFPNV